MDNRFKFDNFKKDNVLFNWVRAHVPSDSLPGVMHLLPMRKQLESGNFSQNPFNRFFCFFGRIPRDVRVNTNKFRNRFRRILNAVSRDHGD